MKSYRPFFCKRKFWWFSSRWCFFWRM